MNVDSMDQSHRETKVKYETELANLREQVLGCIILTLFLIFNDDFPT